MDAAATWSCTLARGKLWPTKASRKTSKMNNVQERKTSWPSGEQSSQGGNPRAMSPWRGGGVGGLEVGMKVGSSSSVLGGRTAVGCVYVEA